MLGINLEGKLALVAGVADSVTENAGLMAALLMGGFTVLLARRHGIVEQVKYQVLEVTGTALLEIPCTVSGGTSPPPEGSLTRSAVSP